MHHPPGTRSWARPLPHATGRRASRVAAPRSSDRLRPGPREAGVAGCRSSSSRSRRRPCRAPPGTPGLDRGELAVEREEITGLTDRAHDVDHLLGSTAILEGDDLVMGIVVAGPHE